MIGRPGDGLRQFDQSRLMGIERLAAEFCGKICFWNTVDIQWSPLEEVTLDELRADARHMIE